MVLVIVIGGHVDDTGGGIIVIISDCINDVGGGVVINTGDVVGHHPHYWWPC